MKKKKFEKCVTGGLSVYYGIGMLLTGIAATIGAIVMAVKIISGIADNVRVTNKSKTEIN